MSNLKKANINGTLYGLEPNDAITKSQLSAEVQASLTKADTALQPADVDAALSDSSTNPVQNKTVTAELEDLADTKAPVILNTASGSIASFADGADGLPIQSLVVNMEPIQDGSGDPSPDNVRPISGRTGVSAFIAGKNLFIAGKSSGTNTSNGITFSYNPDGSITLNGQNNGSGSSFSVTTTNSYKLKPGTYKKPVFRSGVGVYVQTKSNDTQWTVVSGGTISSDTFTISESDAKYELAVRIQVSISTSSDVFTDYTIYPYIYLASETDLTWEPPAFETITVSWQTEAGTVYGGTLDVISGKLTVDRVCHELTGSEEFALATNTRRFTKAMSNLGWETPNTTSASENQSDALCSHGEYQASSTLSAPTMNFRFGINPPAIAFYDPAERFANEAAFNSYLAEQYANSTPVSVSYKILNPTVYQLTPTEVKTLLGINNIWSDAGDVDVTYPADTKMYIDGKLAGLQALILENIGG